MRASKILKLARTRPAIGVLLGIAAFCIGCSTSEGPHGTIGNLLGWAAEGGGGWGDCWDGTGNALTQAECDKIADKIAFLGSSTITDCNDAALRLEGMSFRMGSQIMCGDPDEGWGYWDSEESDVVYLCLNNFQEGNEDQLANTLAHEAAHAMGIGDTSSTHWEAYALGNGCMPLVE